MRRALWAVALAALMGAPGAWAQDVGGEDDPVRNQALRQQIEDRFAERIKAEIGLTDQQLGRLRATSTTYGSRRRDLAAQERTLRGALADQMRPGVAANQDSVSKLTDGLVITIEPIISAGNGRVTLQSDKWTIATDDRSWAAHYEHTLVITKNGPVLLTV